jgi:hypothetical protein
VLLGYLHGALAIITWLVCIGEWHEDERTREKDKSAWGRRDGVKRPNEIASFRPKLPKMDVIRTKHDVC